MMMFKDGDGGRRRNFDHRRPLFPKKKKMNALYRGASTIHYLSLKVTAAAFRNHGKRRTMGFLILIMSHDS